MPGDAPLALPGKEGGGEPKVIPGECPASVRRVSGEGMVIQNLAPGFPQVRKL